MGDGEVIGLYELSHTDLTILSSRETNESSLSSRKDERLEIVKRSVMEALGPSGPGLLSVTGVPKASILRRQLLPLARQLALLSPEKRKIILKEHNLGSDVPLKNPERKVSSFAKLLKYDQSFKAKHGKQSNEMGRNLLDAEGIHDARNEDKFEGLEGVFEELGFCMMELGLSVARICDQAIGGNELEKSLIESCAAKGRLIHYHSATDRLVLREAVKTKAVVRRNATYKAYQKPSMRHLTPRSNSSDAKGEETNLHGIHYNLWQQWHYDYGVFTVLTDPMFLSSNSSSLVMPNDEFPVSHDLECASPSGHSYLQIYHPGKNKVLRVKAPPESFIIQVGEAADIVSRGKLRPTLHCVRKPEKLENISRETFVVFLQPAWNKTFWVSDYLMEHAKLGYENSGDSKVNELLDNSGACDLAVEIQKIVPPLSSRLKNGMTFAEFSRETTKQYYGGSGLQSNG